MAKRELKKLRRADLLKLMLEQAKENEALKADLEQLKLELEQRPERPAEPAVEIVPSTTEVTAAPAPVDLDAAQMLLAAADEAKREIDQARSDAMLIRLGATKEAEILRAREQATCDALWEETHKLCDQLLTEAQDEIDRLFAEAMEAFEAASASVSSLGDRVASGRTPR